MLYFSGFVEVIIIVLFYQGLEASRPQGWALVPLLCTPPVLSRGVLGTGVSGCMLWCNGDGEQRPRQVQTHLPSSISAGGSLGSRGCPGDAKWLQNKPSIKIRSNLDILVAAFPPHHPVCFLTCACMCLCVRLCLCVYILG